MIHSLNTHVTCFECRHKPKLKKWDPQQKNTHSQKYESGDIINEQWNSANSVIFGKNLWRHIHNPESLTHWQGNNLNK